jgi:hypothetical protein
MITGIGVARLPLNLPLRCRCGRVRGIASEVSPASTFRFVCYCKDCQALARFLDRSDVLDAAGGTEIFQMPPGRVKLTAGADALRCLRLSDRGVLRWYTECCRTPIANTAGAGFPIIGMIHSFVDHEGGRDEALGLTLCGIYTGSAIGPLPSDAPPPPSLRVFFRRGLKMLSWWVHGLGRPNPFFDDRTNAPIFVPRVLTQSERATL